MEIELDRPLGPDEGGPIEHCGTQLDERRIQGPQRMLEPEPPTLQGRHRLTSGEHLIEERLVHLPRSMGIGIRECRAGWGPSHAEVHQFAEGCGQPPTNLAEGVRAPHLTEQHAHELLPTREPFGPTLSLVLPHGASESRAIDQGEDLRKTTGNGYHTIPPACG